MKTLISAVLRSAASVLPSSMGHRVHATCAVRPMDAVVHELCFASLSEAGAVKIFPCDSRGNVELDALSPLQRNDYLFVRALIGRDFTGPFVRFARAGNPGSTDLRRSSA